MIQQWVTLLTAALQLAAWIAKRADKLETEGALLNELGILQGERAKAAYNARADVISGRVQPNPTDPNRRD